MESKTRNLVLMLEVVALAVAGILILIDYKLKKDLLALFIRIEKAIAHGNETVVDGSTGNSPDSSLHLGNLVADPPGMEAQNGAGTRPADIEGKPGRQPRGTSPKSSRGTGDNTPPPADKPVGA